MAARGTRTRGQRQRRDDRPYVIVLFGLLVVIGAMAVGPMRSLAAANDRVEQLAEERDVLASEVGNLERQKTNLNDPAELEVYAREHLGLIRPGEIPYVVLPEDEPAGGAAPGAEGPSASADPGADDLPWYERLADAVSSLFGG